MRCMDCGGMAVSSETGQHTSQWSDGSGCVCQAESDAITRLLRLLTLLANCGLSAGAPPVLRTRQRT
jgi:hypothetical protein